MGDSRLDQIENAAGDPRWGSTALPCARTSTLTGLPYSLWGLSFPRGLPELHHSGSGCCCRPWESFLFLFFRGRRIRRFTITKVYQQVHDYTARGYHIHGSIGGWYQYIPTGWESKQWSLGGNQDEYIRDQPMMHMSNPAIQKKLWSARNPTLLEALDIARGEELTNKCVRVMNEDKAKDEKGRKGQEVSIVKAKVE
ncbi:hypothetical protein NDU88_003024 [Pleurodeles waltl]|uniref:Uncharacterized protein n=1 Tax=Pleurodeles waltl TaxID=8319 RepID=A0AAV7NNK4_PLEWA|nr:hypothetical protein NDU88_003024 [Pleurodeles waltl]